MNPEYTELLKLKQLYTKELISLQVQLGIAMLWNPLELIDIQNNMNRCVQVLAQIDKDLANFAPREKSDD